MKKDPPDGVEEHEKFRTRKKARRKQPPMIGSDEQAQYYKALAHAIDTNEMLTVPTPMAFEELEELVESYGD